MRLLCLTPLVLATAAVAADGHDLTRSLLIEAQARGFLAGQAAENAESDVVREYAKSVQEAAKANEEKLTELVPGTFDVRPTTGDAEDDSNGKTAAEAGLLAAGAKPVEPSPGRWNPPGSRAVNAGVLTPGGDPDAATGPDAAPAGSNEDAADADPALRASKQVDAASQALAKMINEMEAADDFDAAYLEADRRRIRAALDALKTPDAKTVDLAKDARKRLRSDLARVKELATKSAD